MWCFFISIFVHILNKLGNVALALEIVIEQAQSAANIHRLARGILDARAQVPDYLGDQIGRELVRSTFENGAHSTGRSRLFRLFENSLAKWTEIMF